MEEIRKIPEGWEKVFLNNIGDIVTGNTPSTNEDSYYDGKYMFISPIDISPNTLYIRKTENTLTESGLEQTRKIPVNSICTVCIGSTIGKIGITTNTCATNQQINTVITNEKNDYKLIFYAMKYYLQQQLRIEAGLQAVPIVNKNRFSQLKLCVPKSILEQQKIAKILSTLDQNIEKTEQTIKKYKKIKNGLMDDLLTGKIRIKDGKWVKETEFKEIEGVGRIPKDWDISKIKDVSFDIFLGLTSKPKYVEKYGIPLIRATNINTEKLNLKNALYIDVKQHRELTKYRKVSKGDVLISKSGNLGTCALIDKEIEMSIYESIICVKPKKEILDSSYLLYSLREVNTQKRMLGDKVGSSVGHLNLMSFRELLIVVPYIREQMKIGYILSKQDQLIEKEQQYLEKLKKLKLGLMEDLLTGKIRVEI